MRAGGNAKQSQDIPFNKKFRLNSLLVPVDTADEMMLASACTSPVIFDGVGCDAVSLGVDTLMFAGSSLGRSCSEIEAAEPSSRVPCKLCSDVVIVPSLVITVGDSSGLSELEVRSCLFGEEKSTEDEENSTLSSE